MDIERDRLHKQLVKLGDMMADGLHYDEPWISTEYRKISKILFPEMYPKKIKKPTSKLLKTMKYCDCGYIGWTYTKYPNGNIGFKCNQCGKSTGECETNIIARDKWNNLFK